MSCQQSETIATISAMTLTAKALIAIPSLAASDDPAEAIATLIPIQFTRSQYRWRVRFSGAATHRHSVDTFETFEMRQFLDHPLALRITTCASPEAILGVIHATREVTTNRAISPN
jgi:hypothetical protein